MNNTSVRKKLDKINETVCIPWGKKITGTLFKGLKDENSETNGDALENSTEENVVDEKKEQPKKQEVNNETSEQDKEEGEKKEDNEKKEVEKKTEGEEDLKYHPRTNPKAMKPVLRDIEFEFDWKSFDDLFSSLINEQADEVIDTILDSLISKDCAISLLSALGQHCRSPEFSGKVPTKHEQIRSFLQQGLKKYIIKYSDDPREWGYYKDGVLCDVVEIDVTENEEINWIFRDVTQNIENCTELQQYIVENYFVPEWQAKAKAITYTPIIDWASIDYAAQDFSKAVYTLYHDRSSYVLEEIYQALDWIASYEDDDLVDAISGGLSQITIALQPGQDSTKKDFDINDAVKCLTLRLCLEADEFAGVFRHKDLIPIIKVAGLYNSNYSKPYKIELLAAAASVYKVPRGDLLLFKTLLSRENFWWEPNEKESSGIELCKKKIDKYYKEKMTGGNDDDRIEDEEEDETEEEFETMIKGWHVIKINKNNLHQERIIVLTNKAYWTFKYDFKSDKVDDKHYKRHDLLDFSVSDIGDLDKITESLSIPALKIYTHEKRKKTIFGEKPKEVLAIDANSKKKSGSFSAQLRKSVSVKSDGGELDLKNFKLELMNTEISRVKKPKPTRERPSTEGDYSSVFIPYGNELSPLVMKDILLEISWCIYAAAVSRQRHRLPEPFLNQSLKRPKGGISAFFYNNLKMGINSGKQAGSKNTEDGESEREKLKRESEEKRKAENSKEPDLKLYSVNNPTEQTNITVKPLLQKPKPQLDAKCSHDRKIHFNPQCQIFYRENDLVIEGKEPLEGEEE